MSDLLENEVPATVKLEDIIPIENFISLQENDEN